MAAFIHPQSRGTQSRGTQSRGTQSRGTRNRSRATRTGFEQYLVVADREAAQRAATFTLPVRAK
ncbi:hypothetical protein ABZ092_33905, partial [Streptomyces bobili]|uniref:hypothetical protein n=1 Tax=Streptomyces bobili TaxID=67280 RepID=UPI0034921079